MLMQSDDDRLILIAAFRYALGRRTYMPGVVAAEIWHQWLNLTSSDQRLIQGEIKEAKERGYCGDACDVATWDKILRLPVKNE